MSTQKKNQLSEIMKLAWQFVKKNGYSMAEALKCAWANMKLKAAMKDRIVKFYFQKVDGSVREAFGTLKEALLPPTNGTDSRKKSETVQVYFDTEKSEYRCFKKANLLSIAYMIEAIILLGSLYSGYLLIRKPNERFFYED